MRRTTNHPILFILVFCLMPLLFIACAEDVDVDEEAEPLGEAETDEVMETTPGTEETAFTDWDLDEDTYLSREEFGTGIDQSMSWDDWDADEDTYLSQEEYDTAFGTYDWYDAGYVETWDVDGDGLLSAEEWETGLFDTWDADDNELLYEDEYDEELFG